MEENTDFETVKERLILAGISELQKHSLEDLSLRKISTLCNVSCAAPYKHFKNKQDFLKEIMLYINCQWTKLRSQVMEAYEGDEKMQVIEVCMAYIKFCMANPNFRNILVMKTLTPDNLKVQEHFYFSREENLIRKYCTEKFKEEKLVEKKIFLVHSIVYGSTYMMDKEHFENTKENLDKVRTVLEEELS